MSWDMWHIHGIGFDLKGSSPDQYRRFITNHMKSLKTMISVDDFAVFCDAVLDEATGLNEIKEAWDSFSIAEPIALIMTNETGIRFEAPTMADEGEDPVLFTAAYPWGFNEKEQQLTLDSLIEIMTPYAEELGVQVDNDIDVIYSG